MHIIYAPKWTDTCAIGNQHHQKKCVFFVLAQRIKMTSVPNSKQADLKVVFDSEGREGPMNLFNEKND